MTPDETPSADSLSAREMEWTAVENGIDYLDDAVRILAYPSAESDRRRELKYAVLHLHAATEVLLKYRLFRENWALVLQKPAAAQEITARHVEIGDFVSCSVDTAIGRLRRELQVAISKEERDQIAALGKSRNALQHYGLIQAEAAIEAMAAVVLEFLNRFLDDHLLPDLPPPERNRVGDALGRIQSGLGQIRFYVEKRLKDLHAQLEPHKERTVVCPVCRQWTLVAHPEGPARCLFCPMTMNPEQAAWLYSAEFVPYRSPPPTSALFSQPLQPAIDACSTCRSNTLVQGTVVSAGKGRSISFCFSCAAGRIPLP